MPFTTRDELRFNEQLAKGNQKGVVKVLYEINFRYLCSFADRFTRSKQESEDMVSDVFYKLLERKWSPSSLKEARSYLGQAVINEFRTNLRTRKKFKVWQQQANLLAPDSIKDPLVIMMDAELLNALDKAIDNLYPRRKEVYKRMAGGQSAKEIALQLNISEQTVRNTKNDGIKQIQEGLQKLGSLAILLPTFMDIL